MDSDISNINWLDLYGKLEGDNHEEVSFSMLCNSSTFEQNEAFTKNIVSLSHEPPQTNIEEGGGASSSLQPSMIETGCLINPFGVPYRPQMMPSIMPTLSSWETIDGTSLVPKNVNLAGQDGKKRMLLLEGVEDQESEMRRKQKKIKNRVSATKSRLKKLERTKRLEEKVAKLRSDNAILKGEIILQKMAEIESELQVNAAEKLRGLRRTLSSPN